MTGMKEIGSYTLLIKTWKGALHLYSVC